MDREIYNPSVKHAAELSGGYDALAKRVGVTSEEVVGWMDGTHTPSVEALLFVLDVVMVKTRKIVDAAMADGLAEQTLAKAAAKTHQGIPSTIAKIQAGPAIPLRKKA